MNPLLIIGSALLLYYLYETVNTGSQLHYEPRAANWDGSNLTVTIGIINPTGNTITLNKFIGSLYANGTYLGPVTDTTAHVLPGNNVETPVGLSYTPDPLGIGLSIVQWINQGNLSIELKGTASVNNLNDNVDLNFQAVPA